MVEAKLLNHEIDHKCEIPINSIPFVGEVGSGRIVQPYRHIDRIANFNVLIYIKKGKMEIVEEGISHTLTSGSLFFLKSGCHHWGENNFEIGTSWNFAHFYTNPILESMELYREPLISEDLEEVRCTAMNAYIEIPKHIQLPLGSLMEEKIETLVNQPNTPQVMERNIMMWEVLLQCYKYVNNQKLLSEKDKIVHKVLTYVEKNYDVQWSSQDLSEAMALSYKYMGTLFKNKMGMPIKSYQQMLRMRAAVVYLGETDMTIKEIAQCLGYCDGFYFSSLFRKEKGVSPTEFRLNYKPRL